MILMRRTIWAFESADCLQSELEDLCFAILHPDCYRKLHEERNKLWSLEPVPTLTAVEADHLLKQSEIRPTVSSPLITRILIIKDYCSLIYSKKGEVGGIAFRPCLH